MTRAPLPQVFISSYTVSPAHSSWDAALEAELLPALCALPGVAGLEVPWLGRIHPHDTEWFLHHVPAGSRLVLTPLPWVMQRCGADSDYGIASANGAGRSAALDDLRAVAGDIWRIQAESPARVSAVALHTAPSRGRGNAARLAASLREIAGWDWGGARLMVEHCDAVRPTHPHQKGFLPLKAEIRAIRDSGTSVGLWLNWGRSVIETRDADAVTAQIAQAAATGLLAGVAFSRAAAVSGSYGAAWEDRHLPLASADRAAGSLLDDAHVADALGAAGNVGWLGLKVSRRPGDRTATDVVRTVRANLDAVRAASEVHPGCGQD